MDTIWTSEDRNEFIEYALNMKDNDRGRRGPYWFNTMSKISKPDNENENKAKVTNVLMNTIFKKPEYRVIALRIYQILLEKIFSHAMIRDLYQRDIVILLKGGSSYTYLIGGNNDIFPYSDLDIVIYINPNLPKEEFENVKYLVNTLVLQTISQYKRTIDHMLFLNKPNSDQFLSEELVEKFKEDYERALNEIDDKRGVFVSAFESIASRNACSKYSFIIADSLVDEDKVVRVEIPHFENCERIPLRKTPLFCSHNRSISFNRTGDDKMEIKGCFDLYRLRWNNLFVIDPELEETASETSPCNSMSYESATADFIDISIPGYEDAELKDFWSHGRFMNVFDSYANIWISIPDYVSVMNDLHKMLYVYECPEAKREKRQKKYDFLKTFIANIV